MVPWADVETKYPVGTRVTGKVVSLTDYGAFVELEQGIEGLIHVSAMSWTKRVKHPSKVMSLGESVEAMVLDLDKENRRLSLGLKQTEPNPWDLIDERYTVGLALPGGLIVEELLFFLLIPVCALLTLESVRNILRARPHHRSRHRDREEAAA